MRDEKTKQEKESSSKLPVMQIKKERLQNYYKSIIEVKGAPYADLHIDGVLKAINDREIQKIVNNKEWGFTKLKVFENLSIAERLDKTRFICMRSYSGSWHLLDNFNQNNDVKKRIETYRDTFSEPPINVKLTKSVKLMISLKKISFAEFDKCRDYENGDGEILLDQVIMDFKIKDYDPVQNLMHAILEQSGVGEVADYMVKFWSYQSKYICNQIYQGYFKQNS